VDKPDEVKIWQKGTHDDAKDGALAWSLRLRRLAQHDLRTLGGTASKLMRSALSGILSTVLLSYTNGLVTCVQNSHNFS
jgi:hypothetical protein